MVKLSKRHAFPLEGTFLCSVDILKVKFFVLSNKSLTVYWVFFNCRLSSTFLPYRNSLRSHVNKLFVSITKPISEQPQLLHV